MLNLTPQEISYLTELVRDELNELIEGGMKGSAVDSLHALLSKLVAANA